MEMVLDLDLNSAPAPVDEVASAGVDVSLRLGLPRESGQLQTQTTTGQESTDDDDVVICSPRSFAEAREKARRNREVIEVIDAENDFRNEVAIRSFFSDNHNRLRRASLNTTNAAGQWINLESNEHRKSNNVAEALVSLQNVPAKSVPPPKPPTPIFNCAVCMGPLVEETSTKCGHIFCKVCIHKALAAQGKCPTCRRKLKVKDTLRVYLPATE